MLVELVIGGLTAGELVEVDQVTVELGAVDAGELDLAAHRHAAAAAHAGAVDHERVERDDGLDAVGAGEIGDGLHHGHGADGVDGLRTVAVAGLEQTLERRGDEAGLAERTVFGGAHKLVREGAELVAQHDELLAAPADDGGQAVARLGEGLGQREQHGGADAAAHAHDAAEVGDVGGLAERPGDVAQGAAHRRRDDLLRGAPDRLDDEGDGARRGVVVGDRQGDALGPFADAHDDELAGFTGARHARRENVHAMELGGDLLVADDFEHADLVSDDRAVAAGPPSADGWPATVQADRPCDRRHLTGNAYRRLGGAAGRAATATDPAGDTDGQRALPADDKHLPTAGQEESTIVV